MYSTCIFCNHSLGANEVLETFPVGRRIAFDARNGRLWVVCRVCTRWNLSPLEERLEIIDACDALFRSARARVTTENIGLARLKEGLDLVRIGRALWPEFASWRYGDQFGRRRWRRFLTMWTLARRVLYSPDAIVGRISIDGRKIGITRVQVDRLRMIGDDKDPWRLQLQDINFTININGNDAQQAAALLLPHMNLSGGNQREVQTSVGLIERAGDPASFVKVIRTSLDARMGKPIRQMPYPIRLALEMAAHEDSERRALRGELKALELAWKDAEEIAAISDEMFSPTAVRTAIERMRSAIT